MRQMRRQTGCRGHPQIQRVSWEDEDGKACKKEDYQRSDTKDASTAPISGGNLNEAEGVTAESLLVATKELRDWQGKLVRATAALIEAVKEAEDGPWEVGSGLK